MESKMKAVEGWKTKQLRELADIRVSNVDKKFSNREKPVKLCNYMDVYTNQYVSDKIQFMEASATAAELERFGLNKDDVIITKDSETPDDIGISAVIVEQIDNLVCGYHLALIRPNTEQVDSIFLAKQLSTARVARFFALHASGSTRYGLPVSTIETVEIPTPPKSEQSKIAEILSTVDRAIEQTEALIAKQQRIKTGLMQDLLTSGIDEHGNLRSEETHKFKDSLLGRIPVEWEVVETKKVCSLITKGTTPKFRSSASPRYSIPYLRVQNLTFSGQINFSEEIAFIDDDTHEGELARSRVFPGDVLQNIVGPPLGKIGIVPSDYPEWNINQAIALFRPNEAVSSKFLCHWLQVPATQTWFDINSKKTSGQQNLTLEHCQQLPIVLPSLDEQNRICLLLECLVVSQRNGESELSKLCSLKTALMQDLLTGKKRVTDLLNDTEAGGV